MKIHIHKTVQIPEIPSAIEIESGTLRSLLDSLLRPTYFAKEIIDARTGESVTGWIVPDRSERHYLPQSS